MSPPTNSTAKTATRQRPHVVPVGERVGRLVATKQRVMGQSHVEARCDCGNDTRVRLCQWGKTQSCGCLRSEVVRARRTTHGMTGSPEYVSWQGLLNRCGNPNEPCYADYGGRGITVCDRWRSFENFFADMGRRPAGTSIDRIDNDGNYEPGNCRWATHKEQRENQRPARTPRGPGVKTHCKRNHEYTPENTWHNKTSGAKICIACHRLRRPSVGREGVRREGDRRRRLTDDQVLEIRQLYATGSETQDSLARAFSVSQSAIHNVVSGKRTLKGDLAS